MREIEKMVKKFLENYYKQKHLEEATLMELFGRDIVLQMSKKYTLPSQEPEAANEPGFMTPSALHKGVQLTLMGGGSTFVFDTQSGPSLNDQDQREERHGILEEGDLPFQLHADGKENAKPKMLLHYSMSSQQAEATNQISDKAPTVLHKGVQMTLIGGGSSSVSSSNIADRHEESLANHVEGCLPFQLYPEVIESMEPEMMLSRVRGISTPNQLEPTESDISHSDGTRTIMPLVDSFKKCSPETKEYIDTPVVDGNDETLCNSNKKDKWECQLCHVMTNTKEVLEQHCQGKKHKKKEKAAQESSIVSQAIEESVNENIEARLEDDLNKLDSGPLILENNEINTNEDAFGTKHKIAPVEEEQGNEIASLSHQNKRTKFWCEVCKFGTYIEATMLDHRMGMEHMEMMQINGGAIIVVINEPSDFPYVAAGTDANSKKYGKVYSRRQKKDPENY